MVEKIARRSGVDPTELEPPLFDIVDPDALDALFDMPNTAATGGDVCISFRYNGYQVFIDGSQQVVVEPVADAEAADPSTCRINSRN